MDAIQTNLKYIHKPICKINHILLHKKPNLWSSWVEKNPRILGSGPNKQQCPTEHKREILFDHLSVHPSICRSFMDWVSLPVLGLS